MELHPAEEEKEIEKIIFPKYSNSILVNKKLKIDELASKRSIDRIIYSNGAYYERTDNELFFPNGEKFKGMLTEDSCKLKRGKYNWPNGQEYYGQFDDKNRFFSLDGEESKLIFPNGDTYLGTFEEGKIGEGKYLTKDEKEISADFTGDKINGQITYNDKKINFFFQGYIQEGKKEGPCTTKMKIGDKIYSIEGEYLDGLKDGIFQIKEISPNNGFFYLKGKYKKGFRHGYFDIVDKEKGINISHKYISFLHDILIKDYKKKYKTNLTGKETNLAITNRNNPIVQIIDLVEIRLSNLLTLDLSRNKITSISFLNTDEKTLFSLQNLNLSNNLIKSIEPLEMVYYPKLKKLKLNDNKIQSIDCIKNFKFVELEDLNLSCNPIDSLGGIEMWKFPNLFNLSLYRTNISDIKPLTKAEFPSLTQIDIYFTKINPNKKIIPQSFTKCKSLKKVLLDSH